MRVAARSRIFSARPQGQSSAPEDWLPSDLRQAPSGASTGEVVHAAESVPADPAAAAELGAEVQRLRRELREAEKLVKSERSRAERAEQQAAGLRERAESMKRAAAQAAAIANPEAAHEDSAGRVDLNSASFEQLRAIGVSVTQAARLIGQREQHGGFASVDDVDGIVGIPKNVKQTLKDHGTA